MPLGLFAAPAVDWLAVAAVSVAVAITAAPLVIEFLRHPEEFGNAFADFWRLRF